MRHELVILLAADDECLDQQLSEIFRQRRWATIGPCKKVSDAMVVIAVSRPDLEIIDFDLPGDHAIELVSAFRGEDIPVCVISRTGPPNPPDALFQDVEWITKPVRVAGLLRSIRI